MGEWGMSSDDSEPGGSGSFRFLPGGCLPGSASIDAAGTDR
jgi:hypothetical protein